MYIRISEYDAIYRSKPRITVHCIVLSFNVVQNTAKKEWYTGDEEGVQRQWDWFDFPLQELFLCKYILMLLLRKMKFPKAAV